MARHLLTKTLSPLTHRTPLSLLSFRTLATKPQFIEIDLEPTTPSPPPSSTSSTGDDLEPVGLQRLEEAFHRMIVKRLEPEWLPFRPGSSYWVPPKKKAQNILELVGKMTSPVVMEQALSFSSNRGFPCSSYFLQGAVSEHPRPVPVVVEVVQVHEQSDSEQTSSDDEA